MQQCSRAEVPQQEGHKNCTSELTRSTVSADHDLVRQSAEEEHGLDRCEITNSSRGIGQLRYLEVLRLRASLSEADLGDQGQRIAGNSEIVAHQGSKPR